MLDKTVHKVAEALYTEELEERQPKKFSTMNKIWAGRCCIEEFDSMQEHIEQENFVQEDISYTEELNSLVKVYLASVWDHQIGKKWASLVSFFQESGCS